MLSNEDGWVPADEEFPFIGAVKFALWMNHGGAEVSG